MENGKLPAFASVAISGNDGYQQDGLTKREYFAVHIPISYQEIDLAIAEKLNDEMAPVDFIQRQIFFSKAEAKLRLIKADELLKQLDQ